MLGRLLVGIAITLGAANARAEVGHDGLGGAAPVRGDDAPHLVAFTFDDGPNEHHTPRILRALARHDIPATFFVIGRDVDNRPKRRALLATIAQAGHVIGNHTWSHARLTPLAETARDEELDRLATFVEAETGRPPTIVRPPYGASSPRLRAALAARGLTEVRWNIDPRDWAFRDPALLRATILDAIIEAGGGIVVLHDNQKATAMALPGVLDDLAAWNCTRVRRGKPPIIPVSLHYFVRDGDQPRPVPAEVEARTQRHREALAARCAPVDGD